MVWIKILTVTKNGQTAVLINKVTVTNRKCVAITHYERYSYKNSPSGRKMNLSPEGVDCAAVRGYLSDSRAA